MTEVPTNRLSLSEQRRTHANAYALVTPEQRWTYAELASQGLSVRHWLNARSLGPHTRCVAFRAPTTPSSVLLAWTLIDLRIPFVPLHPRWSEHDCDTAVLETNADLLQVPAGFPCVQPGVQQAAASEVTASEGSTNDEATL